MGGFAESERGRFDEEVLGGWIRGEDVEAFSKDPFELVEARIISSGEGKVMGITGGAGGGDGELGIAVSESGGQDSHGRRSHWAIILKLPLDGQYYCTIFRTKNKRDRESHEQLIVYCTILQIQDFQVAQYISKSFNTINIIVQSFNPTHKHPILLCNLKYCAIILSV